MKKIQFLVAVLVIGAVVGVTAQQAGHGALTGAAARILDIDDLSTFAGTNRSGLWSTFFGFGTVNPIGHIEGLSSTIPPKGVKAFVNGLTAGSDWDACLVCIDNTQMKKSGDQPIIRMDCKKATGVKMLTLFLSKNTNPNEHADYFLYVRSGHGFFYEWKSQVLDK